MPQIIIEIPDAIYEQVRPSFLRVYPVPLDVLGRPVMGEGQWIKKQFVDFGRRTIREGERLLFEEANPPVHTPDAVQ